MIPGIWRRLAIASLLVVVAATGCVPVRRTSDYGTPAGSIDPAGAVGSAVDNYEYRLGPGDRVSIKVFGQADVSGEFELDGQGQVAMPLVGQVQAANKTIPQFREAVVKILDEKFLVDPKVSIEVTNYRPFYVLGQVNNSGSYPYRNGLNMRMAIALAGGYTRRASEEPLIVVRRDEEGNLTRYWAAQDTPVLPGDTIEVRRRIF